jgi:hypothetical protein
MAATRKPTQTPKPKVMPKVTPKPTPMPKFTMPTIKEWKTSAGYKTGSQSYKEFVFLEKELYDISKMKKR